jgi:hypothetical protein
MILATRVVNAMACVMLHFTIATAKILSALDRR